MPACLFSFIRACAGVFCGVLLVVCMQQAQAKEGNTLYSCKDASGKTVYVSEADADKKCVDRTVKPRNGAAKTPAAAPPPKPAAKGKPKPAAAPASKPVHLRLIVDEKQQKQRDKKRVDILVHELGIEQRATERINRLLASDEEYDEKTIGFFEKRLRIHSQNIVSITQELERLGVAVRRASYSGN